MLVYCSISDQAHNIPVENALINRLDCIDDKIPSKPAAVKNVQSSRFVTPKSVNFIVV